MPNSSCCPAIDYVITLFDTPEAADVEITPIFFDTSAQPANSESDSGGHGSSLSRVKRLTSYGVRANQKINNHEPVAGVEISCILGVIG